MLSAYRNTVWLILLCLFFSQSRQLHVIPPWHFSALTRNLQDTVPGNNLLYTHSRAGIKDSRSFPVDRKHLTV